MSILNEVLNGDISTSNKKTLKSGILGILKGTFADIRKPTRNGRLYSEECWERALNSEDVREKLENRTMLGELDHPADRLETAQDRSAVIISNLQINKAKGIVEGTAEILDTPCGRILKTLVDAGVHVGISSRGTGEEVYSEGYNKIDPESFYLETFDIVTTPAVKAARLSLVESKQRNLIVESVAKELKESKNDEQKETIKSIAKNILTESEYALACPEISSNIEAASDTGAVISANDLTGTLTSLLTIPSDTTTNIYSLRCDPVMTNTTADVLNAMNSDLAQKDTELAKAKQELQSITDKLLNLSQELYDVTVNFSKTKEELDTANDSLEFVKDENLKLQQEVKKFESLSVSQASELIENKQVQEENVKTIESLNKLKEEKEAEISNLTAKIEGLENQISDLQSKAQDTRFELDLDNEEVVDNEHAIALQSEIESLKEKLMITMNQSNKHADLARQERASRLALEKQLKDLNVKCSKLESTNKTLINSKLKLEKDLNDYKFATEKIESMSINLNSNILKESQQPNTDVESSSAFSRMVKNKINREGV